MLRGIVAEAPAECGLTSVVSSFPGLCAITAAVVTMKNYGYPNACMVNPSHFGSGIHFPWFGGIVYGIGYGVCSSGKNQIGIMGFILRMIETQSLQSKYFPQFQ